MADVVHIEQFLELSASFPVIDVRAPVEYFQGHIPGAINIPLFNDQERKEVGTAYKRINKESAMYLGLGFAGKKLVELAKEGERQAGRNKTLLVHCWRGGMRSKSMVWLFETLGITCYLLEGGYKSYRRYFHDLLERPMKLNVVGGRTGSGKTDLLHQLEKRGEQVVDLEGLANHKGSAFGALGEDEQPIGKCVIPGELFSQMRDSKVIFLDIPREMRAQHLVVDYASYDAVELKSCIFKIERRLGGDRTKAALESIDQKDFYTTAMITLHYYDKAYMHSLEKNHDRYHSIVSDVVDSTINADLLLKYFGEGT